VAVTVDMIATGTDIKPLEILLFLRDVRSALYYEQMKGRKRKPVRLLTVFRKIAVRAIREVRAPLL
jgi:type I site-specific restriction endonuclease